MRHIFDSKGNHNPFRHLARIVSFIGTPPAAFVKRSETTEQCFNVNGKSKLWGLSMTYHPLES